MSLSKQKKPFLKKGTRQFLSNAQVRSQSTKPKIVDFGQPEQEFVPAPSFRNKSSQNIDPNYDEIKIKVGPSAKMSQPPKTNQQSTVKKQQKPIGVAPRNADTSANKRKQTSLHKKKEAALSDYLDNDSQAFANHRPNKNPITKTDSGHKKPEQKKFEQQKKLTPKASMKNTYLVQQQDEDEQQTGNFFQNDSFKPINNPYKSRSPIANNKVPQNNRFLANNNPPKRKISDSDQQQNKQQINFISDKSDQQEQAPKFRQQNNMVKNTYQNAKKYQAEQQTIQNPTVTVSKVKMNYFNKGNEDKTKQSLHQQKVIQKVTQKVLSINDIPKQLKQQIVKQTIAEKEQQLHQQLQKLKQKFAIVKKEKQKIEEEQKNLNKAKLEFEKQMEQKNKEFQEKLKNQNSKLAREKKYMKDAQMQGQGDRKVKNQLQEIRKLLQKQKQDRKKVESKYKIQVENLRKKLGEEMSKNKVLAQQIKLLQYGQIIQKQQMQQIARQQKKNLLQTQKVDHWTDAPRFTYLNRFFQDNFSLIEMDLGKFGFQQNEYYQYYLSLQDCDSPLESESADQDKSKRQYKNGKVQVEHFKKFLKQIYPFNYTVVNLWNGDIKQILPQGIVIYFSKNSGATQYCVKKNNCDKQIIYFPNSQTVQMKVTNHGDPRANFNQVYCYGHLKRTFNDGTVILQKKDNKGKIISMPSNH